MRLKCTTGRPKIKIHITFHIYLKVFEKGSTAHLKYVDLSAASEKRFSLFFYSLLFSPKLNHMYNFYRAFKL